MNTPSGILLLLVGRVDYALDTAAATRGDLSGAAKSDQRWKTIEPGDVEAAMRTAAAIGDDRLQKQAQGYAIPDSFTHGSSEQRQRWFQNGLKGGSVKGCNTFDASAGI